MHGTTSTQRGTAAWAARQTREALEQGPEEYSSRCLDFHRALITGEIDYVAGRGSSEHIYRSGFQAGDMPPQIGLTKMLEDLGFTVLPSTYELGPGLGLALIIRWQAS